MSSAASNRLRSRSAGSKWTGAAAADGGAAERRGDEGLAGADRVMIRALSTNRGGTRHGTVTRSHLRTKLSSA
jgi:hypothetical protein